MSSGSRWKFLCAQIAVFAMLTITAVPLAAQTGKPAPFKDLPSYLAWMQKNHKAPFIRNFPIAQTGARALQEATVSTHSVQAVDAWKHRHAFQNVQVNQDRNPWPKAGVAAAVNPLEPNTWLVMSNDFRENVNHMFYHVSTDRGRTWTDDALTGGADPFTGTPLTEQSNPGVSFDNAGNSYFSSFSGNLIVDSNNNYLNLDSEVDEVQGLADGTYSSLFPTPIDTQSCSGMLFGPFTCDATLSQPSNSTDANPNSPNAGTTYVYYTYFCNLPIGTCTDGNAIIPAFGSVILESHSVGPGGAFSEPSLVSGALATAQFSDMVIDPSGTPHIFFDDFTNAPVINLWESTFTGGVWTVSSSPVATFTYSGLANPNWGFSDSGAAAPGCGIHHFTAYCAFSANQVSGGRVEGTPSVYLASVNVSTGASRITRVNNDAFNDLKDHFFAWATATPAGAVYVGWYDDRHDSLNTNVEYFVGRSFDEGRTFPIQKAVNDIPFNPCNGFPGCGYFGDYTQLVSGPDGVVHAAWSDTRDGSSMQIWSQVVHF